MIKELATSLTDFDLPGFIAQHYPSSGARPQRAASVRAVWRGDRRESFSLYHKRGKWLFFDHATLQHGDAYDFLTQVLTLPKREVVTFLLGDIRALVVPPPSCKAMKPVKFAARADLGKVIRHYDYLDLEQQLVLQVLRYEPKDFRQRRPLEVHWVWGVTEGMYFRNALGDWTRLGRGEGRFFAAAPPVLYHYPELTFAIKQRERIILVDGEKDVETLAAFGISATCVPKGMGSWQEEHSRLLRGAKQLIVVADNEPHGGEKARRVIASLAGCDVDCVVRNVPVGKDVSDFVRAGATMPDLERFFAYG